MKRGSVRDGFKVVEDGIEPLDVADLQDAILLPGQLDEFGRLRGVVGHRLFDEHVFALLEQRPGEVKMRDRGRDNAQRRRWRRPASATEPNTRALSFLAAICCAVSASASKMPANSTCPARGQIRVNARVFLAERAGAQHGDFYL